MIYKPLNDAEGLSASKLLDRLASPLESLANLAFLALEEAEHPEKVRLYMRMAEEQIDVIRRIALKSLGLDSSNNRQSSAGTHA